MSTNNGKSVFAKYIESPKKEPLEPEIIQMGKDTVLPRLASVLAQAHHQRARYLHLRSPLHRDRESAIDLAKILVEYGWLAHPYQIAPAR